MAIVESPAGLSLPSAILEAAMGLGTLEVAYHETGAIRTAKASSRCPSSSNCSDCSKGMERNPLSKRARAMATADFSS